MAARKNELARVLALVWWVEVRRESITLAGVLRYDQSSHGGCDVLENRDSGPL